MARQPKQQTAAQNAPDRDTPPPAEVADCKPKFKAKPKPKRDVVLTLLRRRNGARMDEITAATGWQVHSARAWLSGLRKQGLTIERTREKDGSSRYRLMPVAGGKPK